MQSSSTLFPSACWHCGKKVSVCGRLVSGSGDNESVMKDIRQAWEASQPQPSLSCNPDTGSGADERICELPISAKSHKQIEVTRMVSFDKMLKVVQAVCQECVRVNVFQILVFFL